ncbi:MAG: HNH endonuclease [Prochlorotrichaceae cyanobacterium]
MRLSTHHIEPVEQGGSDDTENLVQNYYEKCCRIIK